MTPHPQPKERYIGCEYTINYGAVMTIRQMMINARIDEVLINRIEETICSRPHTPAAPKAPFLATFDFEKFDNNVQKWMEVHDATIRNATLDELHIWVEAMRDVADVRAPDDEEIDAIKADGEKVAYTCMLEKLESLRNTQSTDSEATDR